MNELMINKIDLIKIDVEGHEFEVLKGMEKALEGGRISRLIVESFRPNLLRSYLEAFDYDVKAINESNLWGYKKYAASIDF
ncbi:MAG: FkbM family methyltransferase [Thermoproteota archaeon]